MTEKNTPASAQQVRAGAISIGTLEFGIKLRRTPRQIMRDLSPLGFSSISATPDSLSISAVQSTGIDKSPRHYLSVDISRSRAVLKYTFSRDEGEAGRKIEAASWLLNILAAGGISEPLAPELSSFISESLALALLRANTNYGRLEASSEEILRELSSLKSRYARLSEEHEAQARQLLDATAKCDLLSRRIASLAIPPDDELDSEVLDWLKSHGGKIDVRSFSSSRGVPARAIEESLSRLTNGGHIERI